MELCQQAASEQDSKKLLKLVAKIDRLLAEKGNGLKNLKQRSEQSPNS
jgi:hypothetical protein